NEQRPTEQFAQGGRCSHVKDDDEIDGGRSGRCCPAVFRNNRCRRSDKRRTRSQERCAEQHRNRALGWLGWLGLGPRLGCRRRNRCGRGDRRTDRGALLVWRLLSGLSTRSRPTSKAATMVAATPLPAAATMAAAAVSSTACNATAPTIRTPARSSATTAALILARERS